jgi:hypothetical protein
MTAKEEIEFATVEPRESKQLLWKLAVWLLCLGVVVLVMWSATRGPADVCRDGDAACVAGQSAQTPRLPAKGGLSPVGLGAADRRSN